MIATTVSVYVDDSRLEMDSVSGKVLGPFCLEIGEEAFPDRGWTDFVGTALASWATEITNLISNASYVAECHFMDGPYWFEAERIASGRLRIGGYERSKDDSRRKLVDQTVRIDELVEGLLGALRKVSAKCEVMGWATEDTKEVANALKSLESRIVH